jgi:hypothetical protein
MMRADLKFKQISCVFNIPGMFSYGSTVNYIGVLILERSIAKIVNILSPESFFLTRESSFALKFADMIVALRRLS